MAATPYASFICSPPFKFIVGPSRSEQIIHSALVARQSKSLDTLINGPMREAQEQFVVWEETDEDTFIRFAEFVYTGSYSEGRPRQRPMRDEKPEVPEGENSEPASEPAPAPASAPRRRVKPPPPAHYDVTSTSKKQELWNQFTNLYPPSPRTTETFVNTARDDCSDVFLSHARVYVFADYYGITRLQTLALQGLRQALTRFVLYDEGCNDISELVSFCFSETVDKGEQHEPLRSLVCFYAACKLETLWQTRRFRDLVETVYDFPSSLVSVLLNRID